MFLHCASMQRIIVVFSILTARVYINYNTFVCVVVCGDFYECVLLKSVKVTVNC